MQSQKSVLTGLEPEKQPRFLSLPETESSSHVILRLFRPLGQGLAAGFRRLVLFSGLPDHLLIWLGLSAVS